MPARAKLLYERHLETMDGKDSDVRTRLGVIFLRSEKQANAKQEFEHVLRHDPAHQRAKAYLGLVLKLQGRLEEATPLMKVR
jgi:Tfp pilus assembly protein PilF